MVEWLRGHGLDFAKIAQVVCEEADALSRQVELWAPFVKLLHQWAYPLQDHSCLFAMGKRCK